MSDSKLYRPEALSPKEWLAETCPRCNGSGYLKLVDMMCRDCGGTGRAVRHQHDAASSITARDEAVDAAAQALVGVLAGAAATREGEDVVVAAYREHLQRTLVERDDARARLTGLSEQLTTARERGRVAEHALTLAKALAEQNRRELADARAVILSSWADAKAVSADEVAALKARVEGLTREIEALRGGGQ